MPARGGARTGWTWRAWLVAAAIVTTAPAVPLAAQSASGIIAGVVRGTDGQLVTDATVSAQRADGSYQRRAATGSDGVFRLAALPPGVYDVTVRRLGFRPVTDTGVTVVAGLVTQIAVTLVPAPRSLTPVVVTTTGEEAGRATEVAPLRVTAQQIAVLPVGVDLNRLIVLTPGARPDQTWGGAGVQANAYRLDGVAINHPGIGGAIVLPSIHWIQQLDVRGLGTGADEGGFQGGLIDVVTKSGSNTRTSSVSANLENAGWNGTNLKGTDITPEAAGRREVEAQGAGPIVHDRLFYFVAGQYMTTRLRALDLLGLDHFSPVQEIATAGSGFGKLTWTPSVHDLVNLGLALGDSTMQHADLTGRETAAATGHVRSPSTILDASWQHTFGSTSILDAKFVSFSEALDVDPYNGPNVPGVATYQLATSESYQNAPFIVRQRPSSLGYSVGLDHFATLLGQHHVRVGVQQEFGGWRDDQTRTAGMTWRPRKSTIDGSFLTFRPGDASTWQTYTPTSWGGETHEHAHVVNGAAFVQDDYTFGRVGLHPGVRVGWWNGSIDPVNGGPAIHAISTSGIDPRLGLTIDVGTAAHPAGLTVDWGRYHQDLFAQMFDRVTGAGAYSDYEVWEYSGPRFSDPTRVITQAQRDSMAALGEFRLIEYDQLNQEGVVKDYHQPFVDEFVVGAHADPSPEFHVEASYAQRNYRDIIALVDKNEASNFAEADSVVMIDSRGYPIADFRTNSGGQEHILVIPKMYIPKNALAEAVAAGLPVPTYLLRDGTTWNPQYEITNPAGARRRFRQFLLNGTMREPGWEVMASLAVTSLRGNFSTVSGYDPNSIIGFDRLVGRGPGPWVRLNEQINGDGLLDNASHLEFKLRSIGDIGEGYRLGVVFYGIYGDRLTPTFTILPYTYRYVSYGLRNPVKTPPVGPPPPDGPQPIPAAIMAYLAGQRINLAPEGSYHYGGYYTLDFHLERPFEAGGVQWNVQLDVFNALGSKVITVVNTSLDASTDPNSPTKFASPLGYVAPRTLRLGAAAAW